MKKSIFNIFISNYIITFSWGIRDIKDIPNGIEFMVNGFKHKGKVVLLFNFKESLVDLSYFNQFNNLVAKQCNIKLENLIETIDNQVEKTDDYFQRVIDYD